MEKHYFKTWLSLSAWGWFCVYLLDDLIDILAFSETFGDHQLIFFVILALGVLIGAIGLVVFVGGIGYMLLQMTELLILPGQVHYRILAHLCEELRMKKTAVWCWRRYARYLRAKADRFYICGLLSNAVEKMIQCAFVYLHLDDTSQIQYHTRLAVAYFNKYQQEEHSSFIDDIKPIFSFLPGDLQEAEILKGGGYGKK